MGENNEVVEDNVGDWKWKNMGLSVLEEGFSTLYHPFLFVATMPRSVIFKKTNVGYQTAKMLIKLHICFMCLLHYQWVSVDHSKGMWPSKEKKLPIPISMDLEINGTSEWQLSSCKVSGAWFSFEKRERTWSLWGPLWGLRITCPSLGGS